MLSILHEEIVLRDLFGHIVYWPKDTVVMIYKAQKGCTVVSERLNRSVLDRDVYFAFRDNSGVSAELRRAEFDYVS